MNVNCNNCSYPSAATIQHVADCFVMTYQDQLLGHQIMPIMDIDSSRYKLTTYSDNLRGGVTPARGPDKRLTISPYVLKGGENTIVASHFGEQVPIPMEFMEPADACTGPHSIENPVSEITAIVAQRTAAARERAIWQVLTTGSFTAMDASGTPLNSYQYLINRPQIDPIWNDPISDTPVHDLMCILRRLPACCSWDHRATMYMNSETAQCILFNQNGVDLNMTGCCERGWDHLSETLTKYRMPKIETYDASYIDSNGAREYYIPTGIITVIGAQDMNEPVGNYMRMRTVGPCSSGPNDLVWVDDSCDRNEFPHKISVRSAASGAPVLKRPKCVASIQTGCAGLDC